jgi:uncharacterized membrane protein YgcG
LGAVALVSLWSLPLSADSTPRITAPVTDNADVISESTERELGQTLRDHYEKTGVQMAVLTVSK